MRQKCVNIVPWCVVFVVTFVLGVNIWQVNTMAERQAEFISEMRDHIANDEPVEARGNYLIVGDHAYDVTSLTKTRSDNGG